MVIRGLSFLRCCARSRGVAWLRASAPFRAMVDEVVRTTPFYMTSFYAVVRLMTTGHREPVPRDGRVRYLHGPGLLLLGFGAMCIMSCNAMERVRCYHRLECVMLFKVM